MIDIPLDKRGEDLTVTYPVHIGFTFCLKPGVKGRINLFAPGYSNVQGKNGVHCSQEGVTLDIDWQNEVCSQAL